MTTFNKIISATLLMGAMVTMSACQKQEGPAESAGKEIDQAMTQAGQKIENAGDKIQEATDQAVTQVGQKMENTGEKLQESAKSDK